MSKHLLAIIPQVFLYVIAFGIAVPRPENSQLWVSLMCQIQRRFNPKQLTLIIPSSNLTDLIDDFLGCYPFPLLIFNEDRVLVQPPRVNAENESAMILLSDAEVPRLLASLTLLPRIPKTRVWLVFTTKVSRSKVRNAFNLMWNKGYVNVVVLRHRLHKIYFYRYYPFSEKTCNQPVAPVLLTRWTPGEAIPEEVFRSYRITNFRGCTLNCGTFHHPPAVIVVNTSSKVEIEGMVSEIMHVVSHALNFQCHLSMPSDGLDWGYTYANGTSYGLQGDVAKNLIDIAFADFLQSVQRWKASDMIKPYRENCLTMLVPSGLGLLKRSIWSVLLDEFSFEMWSFLSLAVAGSAIFAGFISRASPTETLWSFTGTVVYVVMTFFGAPVRNRPESAAARLFFTMWFPFSMVAGIAYLASFSSLVTVPWRPNDIDTLAAVLKLNLTVYTYPTLLVFLADEDDKSLEAQIAKRAVTSKTRLRVLVRNLAVRRDHAVLFPKMNIKFELARLDRSEAAKVS